jgi:hypothetical protein
MEKRWFALVNYNTGAIEKLEQITETEARVRNTDLTFTNDIRRWDLVIDESLVNGGKPVAYEEF